MENKVNILILTLITGEEVIANVKDHVEEVDGVEQKLCYNLVYPFTISRAGDISQQRVGVTLTPWKFFSRDTSFLVGFDKILNICAPLDNITETYKDAVDQFIKSLAGVTT
tara:strand:+ start:2632 stop:2964 length:333 start_codon:yes stop_codon:yes gene_type:complete